MAPKGLKGTIDLGGTVVSAWSVLWTFLPAAWQTGATLALTGAAVYLGIPQVGAAWAIFIASGVLAFGMTTVFLTLRISQLIGMFQRLSVPAYGISSISLSDNQSEIEHVNFNAQLRNDSQRPMFYRLKRMHVVVEQRTGVSETVDPNIIIIPAFGGTTGLNFATIQHIPLHKGGSGPQGQVELEVEYGPSADELTYLLRQVVTLGMGLSAVPGAGGIVKTKQKNAPMAQMQAQLFTQIKILEHSKNRR